MPEDYRPRVLLADDYAGLLPALKRLLDRSCDVVGMVSNGAQLLEAAQRLQPNVIVVDVRLPDIDGLEACRRITAAGLPARIVVLTAADDPSTERQAFEAGASAFVLKYRAGDDLLPAIENACRTRRRWQSASSSDPDLASGAVSCAWCPPV